MNSSTSLTTPLPIVPPRTPTLMTRSLRFATVFLGVALCAAPALAVNKDMVQLQTQVQELQDAIARLQQSNDERMGVMKDLVQQTSDSVNKMSVVVQTLQRQMQTQQDAQNGKIDQVSGQIQSLNDSVDELKARLTRMEKSLQDIQGQQQSMNANLQNGGASGQTGAPASGAPLPATAPTTAPPPQSNDNPAPIPEQAPSVQQPPRKPSADVPQASNGAPGAPPADDLYKTALGDYMGARNALATSEFNDVVKFYPDNPLSGNALFYLGEMDYRSGRFGSSIKTYDRVLTEYPASNKIPASHLHKGEALLAMHQNDAGIRELRVLIQRFPNSPEAMQARSRLSGMGVAVTPRH
jgi:TolA-binding protein